MPHPLPNDTENLCREPCRPPCFRIIDEWHYLHITYVLVVVQKISTASHECHFISTLSKYGVLTLSLNLTASSPAMPWA